MDMKIGDSSFVIITGSPQENKHKRISHVRSHIRNSRLRHEVHQQRRRPAKATTSSLLVSYPPALGSPERQLAKTVDLSWLPVSEAICERMKAFFRQYIESSAYVHPFLRSMIPAMVVHVPLMSAKLVNATAWDDLNGPDCEISELTLFQRGITQGIISDSIADSKSSGSDINITALMTLLAFEIVNGDKLVYNRYKGIIYRLVESRGGLDKLGFDGNLKISLLAIEQLEKVIKGFSESPSPLDTISLGRYDQHSHPLSLPNDFKVFTFEQGQKDLWSRQINISTLRLLSDFYQLVTLSICYHRSSDDPVRRQRTLIHWHFLHDNLVMLKSTPYCVEMELDHILLNAIFLFASEVHDDYSQQKSVNELRNILWKFKVDNYHGPLPGALIWCLAVGARNSSPDSFRKWFLMQLTRIACPSALDDPTEVSNNLDLILAGLDTVRNIQNAASEF
ncbi:hypothetical protein BGW36DRAFT_376469 [Talaromyces proteolyticus]|uniref:Transcription factor domain-containing protein n=1 Tax=Talaromyces proteolyticus TaxID=1131652 RepID=A0AAD4KR66_9EURO|nr:uncharacterized protein BGW36DRAFT_376469 [Talaromyces proteolyticus]KAH8698615.1 hypothetical protein BGW36DRAFT_376469 [Talaromyces proteolyticus]